MANYFKNFCFSVKVLITFDFKSLSLSFIYHYTEKDKINKVKLQQKLEKGVMILILAYLTERQKLIINFWHKDWKKITGLENTNLLKLKILMMTSISFCCCCCCFIFCFVQRVTECKILKIDFTAWSFGSKISANEYTVQHPVSHLTQIVQCWFQSFCGVIIFS